MELTKKHFDNAITGLVTKEHFERVIGTTEKLILKRIDESQEDLARLVADTIAAPFTKRFDRLEELLEVKEDVQALKRQMTEIRSALHLSPL